MMKRVTTVSLLATLAFVVRLNAANTVVVESKSVQPGASGVTLGIHLANDDSLRGLALPLELRTATGAAFYTDSIVASVQGRFDQWDDEAQGVNLSRFIGQKSAFLSTSCPPDSFGMVWGPAPMDSVSDLVSPDAFLYWGFGLISDIPPGDDGVPGAGVPTFLLTFDVGPDTGSFMVDTICIAPDNHLLFITGTDPLQDQIVPDFTPGVVSVTCDCSCHADPQCDSLQDVFDVVLTVDVAFRSGTPIVDPLCPRERTDVNCDDLTDVFDVVGLVDVAFRGGDPSETFCDPCGGL